MKTKKRSFGHWTPRYLFNRIKEIIFQKLHSDYPWLTPTAIEFLQSWLKKTDIGLEFGSGRSTLYFAARVGTLTSVEHDSFWYQMISKKIKERNITNTTYFLFELEGDEKQAKINPPYAGVAQRFSEQSLDFALIDGVYRGACANAVINLIRPGGILIVDNVNWFLPSKTLSPSSRSYEQGPVSAEWENFLEAVKDWRCIWTSSGVTDTAIFIKPCR